MVEPSQAWIVDELSPPTICNLFLLMNGWIDNISANHFIICQKLKSSPNAAVWLIHGTSTSARIFRSAWFRSLSRSRYTSDVLVRMANIVGVCE